MCLCIDEKYIGCFLHIYSLVYTASAQVIYDNDDRLWLGFCVYLIDEIRWKKKRDVTRRRRWFSILYYLYRIDRSNDDFSTILEVKWYIFAYKHIASDDVFESLTTSPHALRTGLSYIFQDIVLQYKAKTGYHFAVVVGPLMRLIYIYTSRYRICTLIY